MIWLHVEDFTNPLCRAIWLHLESGNSPHCQPLIDLVEMSDVLGRDYDLHPRLRSPAELATLQFQSPEKPAVLEYGRILVESRIRREVTAMGLRLESLATGAPEQIIGEAAHALASLEGWTSVGKSARASGGRSTPTSLQRRPSRSGFSTGPGDRPWHPTRPEQ